MKLVLAQFESNLAYHSAHSYYYFVVVVLVHERLELGVLVNGGADALQVDCCTLRAALAAT